MTKKFPLQIKSGIFRQSKADWNFKNGQRIGVNQSINGILNLYFSLLNKIWFFKPSKIVNYTRGCVFTKLSLTLF